MVALGNFFFPFVQCGPGVGQGDVLLLHQTEVADPHPPTVRWRKAEDGGVCSSFISQMWLQRVVLWACLQWVKENLSLKVFVVSAMYWLRVLAPVDKVVGLALPLQWAGLWPAVAALDLNAYRWSGYLLGVPQDYPALLITMISASKKSLLENTSKMRVPISLGNAFFICMGWLESLCL